MLAEPGSYNQLQFSYILLHVKKILSGFQIEVMLQMLKNFY